MAVEITYFVHGTTTDNEQHLATGWIPGELSEAGKQQSVELGRLVDNENFDIVFCSDLKRAIDSGSLSFAGKYTLLKDERLRECNYGDLNGTAASGFKNRMTEYIDESFPNGESYRDVEQRMKSFLNFLKSDYQGKHVAIVAHEAPQLALEVLLHDRTWQQAIDENWRKRKAWQPGWKYELK